MMISHKKARGETMSTFSYKPSLIPSDLNHYLEIFAKVVFVIMVFFLLIPITGKANEDSLDDLDNPTTMVYKDEIINSLPKMPPVVEDPKPKGQLQIGIKKRVENCKRKAQKGDSLHIHYRGSLKANGAEFDNSYKRGQPIIFSLGTGHVIKGWDQGLLGICAGEKRKLIIPPHLAYGDSGSPPSIPPESTLVFEIEAVKVEDLSRVEL